MAYVAVDEDGTEAVYSEKPYRFANNQWDYDIDADVVCVELPKGSIEKLIGRKLTWEDEPVELKEENE